MSPRRSNARLFFLTLAVLATAAIAINWWYNAGQQLTPEKLRAAVALWEQHGPSDYDLKLKRVIRSGTGSEVREELAVRVRGGKATEATLNGSPLEPRLLPAYDMLGWFDHVERFLELDRKPGRPRVFTRARFGPADGRLIHYVRRVGGTTERQELAIELTPPGP